MVSVRPQTPQLLPSTGITKALYNFILRLLFYVDFCTQIAQRRRVATVANWILLEASSWSLSHEPNFWVSCHSSEIQLLEQMTWVTWVFYSHSQGLCFWRYLAHVFGNGFAVHSKKVNIISIFNICRDVEGNIQLGFAGRIRRTSLKRCFQTSTKALEARCTCLCLSLTLTSSTMKTNFKGCVSQEVINNYHFHHAQHVFRRIGFQTTGVWVCPYQGSRWAASATRGVVGQ